MPFITSYDKLSEEYQHTRDQIILHGKEGAYTLLKPEKTLTEKLAENATLVDIKIKPLVVSEGKNRSKSYEIYAVEEDGELKTARLVVPKKKVIELYRNGILPPNKEGDKLLAMMAMLGEYKNKVSALSTEEKTRVKKNRERLDIVDNIQNCLQVLQPLDRCVNYYKENIIKNDKLLSPQEVIEENLNRIIRRLSKLRKNLEETRTTLRASPSYGKEKYPYKTLEENLTKLASQSVTYRNQLIMLRKEKKGKLTRKEVENILSPTGSLQFFLQEQVNAITSGTEQANYNLTGTYQDTSALAEIITKTRIAGESYSENRDYSHATTRKHGGDYSKATGMVTLDLSKEGVDLGPPSADLKLAKQMNLIEKTMQEKYSLELEKTNDKNMINNKLYLYVENDQIKYKVKDLEGRIIKIDIDQNKLNLNVSELNTCQKQGKKYPLSAEDKRTIFKFALEKNHIQDTLYKNSDVEKSGMGIRFSGNPFKALGRYALNGLREIGGILADLFSPFVLLYDLFTRKPNEPFTWKWPSQRFDFFQKTDNTNELVKTYATELDIIKKAKVTVNFSSPSLLGKFLGLLGAGFKYLFVAPFVAAWKFFSIDLPKSVQYLRDDFTVDPLGGKEYSNFLDRCLADINVNKMIIHQETTVWEKMNIEKNSHLEKGIEETKKASHHLSTKEKIELRSEYALRKDESIDAVSWITEDFIKGISEVFSHEILRVHPIAGEFFKLAAVTPMAAYIFPTLGKSAFIGWLNTHFYGGVGKIFMGTPEVSSSLMHALSAGLIPAKGVFLVTEAFNGRDSTLSTAMKLILENPVVASALAIAASYLGEKVMIHLPFVGAEATEIAEHAAFPYFELSLISAKVLMIGIELSYRPEAKEEIEGYLDEALKNDREKIREDITNGYKVEKFLLSTEDQKNINEEIKKTWNKIEEKLREEGREYNEIKTAIKKMQSDPKLVAKIENNVEIEYKLKYFGKYYGLDDLDNSVITQRVKDYCDSLKKQALHSEQLKKEMDNQTQEINRKNDRNKLLHIIESGGPKTLQEKDKIMETIRKDYPNDPDYVNSVYAALYKEKQSQSPLGNSISIILSYLNPITWLRVIIAPFKALFHKGQEYWYVTQASNLEKAGKPIEAEIARSKARQAGRNAGRSVQPLVDLGKKIIHDLGLFVKGIVSLGRSFWGLFAALLRVTLVLVTGTLAIPVLGTAKLFGYKGEVLKYATINAFISDKLFSPGWISAGINKVVSLFRSDAMNNAKHLHLATDMMNEREENQQAFLGKEFKKSQSANDPELKVIMDSITRIRNNSTATNEEKNVALQMLQQELNGMEYKVERSVEYAQCQKSIPDLPQKMNITEEFVVKDTPDFKQSYAKFLTECEQLPPPPCDPTCKPELCLLYEKLRGNSTDRMGAYQSIKQNDFENIKEYPTVFSLEAFAEIKKIEALIRKMEVNQTIDPKHLTLAEKILNCYKAAYVDTTEMLRKFPLNMEIQKICSSRVEKEDQQPKNENEKKNESTKNIFKSVKPVNDSLYLGGVFLDVNKSERNNVINKGIIYESKSGNKKRSKDDSDIPIFPRKGI